MQSIIYSRESRLTNQQLLMSLSKTDEPDPFHIVNKKAAGDTSQRMNQIQKRF
jgi:hypothetical protein